MIFTDVQFYFFFLAVFAVYWAIPWHEWRKRFLLGASAVFYAAWDWRFLGLVGFVIVNTYLIPLLVARAAGPKTRQGILIVGIAVSLGVLGFFKYFNFFVDSFMEFFHLTSTTWKILLPVGISFYTFHSISYMVDTWRGKIEPTRNFTDVALYILFFPQLVAGPIVRATDLLPQMRVAKQFSAIDFRYPLLLFLVGYFKKAVVSDNLSPFVDSFFAAPAQYNGGDALIAALFYAAQIYCDFSGYTDMAIAVAAMLGYQLKPNFAHPYFAANLIEFWRRWHISLSSWLRDYLYIPLGGNRDGTLAQYRNIFITMLLGGLWHGANWTFVAWGGLHGLGLIVCHLWRKWRGTERNDPGLYSVSGHALTFLWVVFLWIIFRSPSFANLEIVLSRFGDLSLPTLLNWSHAAIIVLTMLATHIFSYRISLQKVGEKIPVKLFAFGYGCALAVILPFVNPKAAPFIYFQF
jgi:alginate O-acetyltransferase complex protein AlgI